MQSSDKLDAARELLDNLYSKIFKDEARIIATLSVPTKSLDATIDELGNSVRWIAISALQQHLGLGGMDRGVPPLIDDIERKSLKHMRRLADEFILGNMPTMSDYLRPIRKK